MLNEISEDYSRIPLFELCKLFGKFFKFFALFHLKTVHEIHNNTIEASIYAGNTSDPVWSAFLVGRGGGGCKLQLSPCNRTMIIIRLVISILHEAFVINTQHESDRQ